MDIVDEFIVTLGLDPSDYKKEMADFRDDLRRSKEETRRTARDMEADGRRAAESFSRLKNEIVGLFLVVAGGRSIGGLVQDMIHGAAETGRFAQSIGLATERVSVWEMAVQSMGGTAQDARAALAALNAEYTSYMLTGRAVHDADLAALGISANDLQSPEQLALALAERRSHMTRREFSARLQRLGLPDSFIRTLAQGRHGVEEMLGSMERLGPVTERDARAAQAFEREWATLTFRLRTELRPILTWLIEQALPWIIEHGPEVARVMGISIAGGVTLMTFALIRAAGPLGIIIAGLTAIIALWDRMPSWSQFGAGLHYRYLGIRRMALDRQLEIYDRDNPVQRDAAGNPLRTARNRQIMQGRQAILQQISDLEEQRLRILQAGEPESAAGSRPTSGPTPAPSSSPGGALARVRQTESGNNYDSVVYNLPSPRRPTAMTLGEIYDFQPSLTRASRGRRGPNDPGSSAIGAYQFIRGTLRTAAEGVFGAGWRNQRFSAGTQDRMAQWLYARDGLRHWAIGGGANLRGGARTAITRNRSMTHAPVSVGSIIVYTPSGTTRQQADAVAREIPRAIQRRSVVTQANKGLN